MDSDEEFKHIDFSSSQDKDNILLSESSDYSELVCEDNKQELVSNDTLFSDDISDDNHIFSSVADYENTHEIVNDKNVEETFTEFVGNINKKNINNNSASINTLENEETTSSFTKTIKKIKLEEEIIETGFTTGNKKKILVNQNIINRTPKFVPSHIGGPMRSYNCPEKGHISSEIEERNLYKYYFEKVENEFNKTDKKLLLIQYRWVWMDLYINKLIGDSDTSTRFIEGIRNRLKSEYSILRRIIEGDDVSYRYMILLVLSVNRNIAEVYDGYFSVRVRLDNMLTRYLQSKNISAGQKIKIFGSKYLLDTNKSILDHNEEDLVMECYYNSFSLSHSNRKLGYRKKISFIKRIKDINKDGGVVSCIKGSVKRIIESKYIVQVKGYRNSVENLEDELDKIQNLIEKTKEEVTNEDVKIRKFVRFILQDESGECLVTSWMYTEQIVKGVEIMLCCVCPVKGSCGLHLTTNKRSFIKFY
jgi:hypothetical protein